jgi:hypothetical protein
MQFIILFYFYTLICFIYTNWMWMHYTHAHVMHQIKSQLKSDLASDHTTKTGASGPATTDLAFNEQVAVWVAHSDTTGPAVPLVVGIE